MRRKYFAYGSCVNVDSFKDTMQDASFNICGVGILNGYRLAFTRESKTWGGGVLDIIESADDYVLGVVYDIPNEAILVLDKRKGAPRSGVRMALSLSSVLNRWRSLPIL